jgi:HSP90 family molecular chaperone
LPNVEFIAILALEKKNMIRKKNKNPYLNFYREIKRCLNNTNLNDYEKLKEIEKLLLFDFSGKWLYRHPSEKFQNVPAYEDCSDLKDNPYSAYLKYVKAVTSFYKDSSYKINKISKQLAFLETINRIQDWTVT